MYLKSEKVVKHETEIRHVESKVKYPKLTKKVLEQRYGKGGYERSNFSKIQLHLIRIIKICQNHQFLQKNFRALPFI